MATSKLKSSPEKTARESGHPAKRPTTVKVSSRAKSKSSDPIFKPKSASFKPVPSKVVEAGTSKQSAVLAMLRKPVAPQSERS